MPNTGQSSIHDVLNMPPFEREVFVKIARDGPFTPQELVKLTGHTIDEIQAVIKTLFEKDFFQYLPDGRIKAKMGRVGNRSEQ